MLSYRHSFHAGNFADVLKHIVVVEIFEHLIKKDKAITYIDTHSGTGLYNLSSHHAQKLSEHRNGIEKLHRKEFPELSRYFDCIENINMGKTSRYYPGSPLIAADFLRHQDKGWLYELHPQDYQFLCKNVSRYRKFEVLEKDGLSGLLSLLPPVSRRGVVLIDPSYEVKSEYDKVVTTIKSGYKKFPTGTYAIWYPVVNRHVIERMEQKFKKSGIKNIQKFELGIQHDSDSHGMTSSGMIVINPPWGLMEKMTKLLPKLAKTLGEDGQGVFRCEGLVEE